MIAKHVSMKTVQKSDFAGLVKYITDEQSKNERVGFVSVTNCQTDQPKAAILEVLNTQAQNQRSGADKTYHLIVSFRPGEQVDDAALKAIEARICAGLGFGEHQRVSAVHHDTDNLHLHIAVNKIHPTRYTIQEPFNAYHTLAQLCDKLEREFGLESDNHKANKLGSENRAADMERHAGIESLLGWVQRECAKQMQAAQTWQELHQVMRENGLELRERGNGLVITSEDGTAVKASAIGREFSKAKLEVRLGAFEPSPEHQARTQDKPKRSYEKRPVRTRINTVELHAKYKAEQQSGNASRAAEWERARSKKDRLIEAAKRSGRLKRAAIKLIKGTGIGKKVMYFATSKTLKDEIEKVNKQYAKERQAIYDKYQRQAWADWLRTKAQQGDQEALQALRARESAQGLKGNTVGGQARQTAAQPYPEQDSITKKGTIIYRVGPTAVRDDGDKLQVSRGASPEGLQEALRLAMKRYGNCIAVTGTPEFKARIVRAAAESQLLITFADANLERWREKLSAGTQATPSAKAKLISKPSLGKVPPPRIRQRLRTLTQLDALHFDGQRQEPKVTLVISEQERRLAKVRAELEAKREKRQSRGRSR